MELARHTHAAQRSSRHTLPRKDAVAHEPQSGHDPWGHAHAKAGLGPAAYPASSSQREIPERGGCAGQAECDISDDSGKCRLGTLQKLGGQGRLAFFIDWLMVAQLEPWLQPRVGAECKGTQSPRGAAFIPAWAQGGKEAVAFAQGAAEHNLMVQATVVAGRFHGSVNGEGSDLHLRRRNRELLWCVLA